MAKQLNVNLAFTADTGQAKAQLQDLQKSLDSLIKGSASNTKLPLTKELVEAQNAATSLKVALNSAVNIQTGKLDITKFSTAMKSAGLDATQLRKQLETLGPGGSQAFLSLTKSVMSAEMPIRRTNTLVAEMWTTLKNTARWQISSSMLHGFMGTMQQAYGYAKDLDESLNNIRIVTNANTEEMARFAENASRAAKALSTTTTAYTNAALIYYQQGNDDQTVLEKTDVTAKMANVTGQSAQVVSEQLTAIWNNFNKEGDKSYEHFADVLTALGAATASSTDEIAGGLEKFAGIADTIGLSYEYAASALATITATSRESEDVVGTALKTIFARIQGLNLGETLDDGTTLNKYSEALSKVGISIFEQNGELKNMDAILAEMGNKWDTLNKDQQMALAQAVAGTRQYNQMMTLMDNWDFMESNLEIARESDGELERQADVYAESWEAARSRVKAASEDLFDSILDEKFFISIANSLEKVIDLSARFVDSLGGLPGVLATVGTLVTKIFSKQLEASIDNMIYGINSLTGVNMKTNKETKESYAKEAEKVSVNDASHEGEALSTGMQQQISLQKELIANEAKLSQEEKARVAHLMDIHQLYVDQAAAAGKAADAARQIVQEQNKEARIKIKRNEKEGVSVDTKEFAKARAEMSAIIKTGRNAQQSIETLGKAFSKTKDPQAFAKQLDVVQNRLNSINKDSGSAKEFSNLAQQFKTGQITAEQFSQGLKKLAESGEIVDDAVIAASDAVKNLGNGQVFTTQETDAMANAELELQNNVAKANGALNAQAQQAQNIKNAIAGAKGAIDTLATSIVKTMQGISQIGMAITSFVSIFDVLNNEDMSFGEKLLSITMSLSMALPALIGGIKTLTAVKWANYAASAKDLAISGARLALIGLEKVGLLGLIGAKSGETAATLGAAAANLTWQATALPILAITLAIVAAIAALVAIAWVLVSVFNAIKASTPEGKLAAAKEEAEELGSVLESTKQAAEELKTAFDGYDSAVDKLEQCTEGTIEWKNALRDVNNEVLGLLSSYPELSTMVNEKGEKAVDYGKDGELKIADWAREEMEAKANQSVLNAQTASTKANQKVRQAEQDILIRDTTKNINQQKGTTATKNVSGQGYDVSEAVSSYIAKHAAELSSMTQEGQQEFLQDYFQSNGIIADSSAWVNAIQNLGTDLGELAATVEANTAATQLENEILTSQMLQDNDKVNASQYKDDIIKASSIGLDEKINAEVQALKDSGWGTSGISKADGVNDEARKIFAEYAEAAGISNYDLTDTTGTDDNRNFVYTDSEGEEVTVSLEAMRQVVAAANASTKVAENAGALVESFAGKAEGEVAAMMATLTKDVKDLTVDQASGKFDVEKFANSLTEKDLQAMGYEGDLETMRADYIAAYNEIAAEGSEALASIVDDYTQSVQNSMNSLIESGSLGELSLEQVDALGATMEEVFTQGGQSALDNFTNIFESVDMSQRDEFVDALGNIDWQTTSVESLRAALEEAGVETSNFSDGALQSLIDTMANGAITIASATEKYNSLHSIVDGLATGDTISEEQFNQFEQYGIEADNYFTKMADGTYKLIGDAEEFYNTVNSESMEGFKQAISDAQNSIADINNILSVGTGNIGTESYNEYENTYEQNASAGTQLDYLEQTDYDLTQIQEWRKELEEGTLDQEELTQAVLDHTEALGGAEAAEELLRAKLEARNAEMEEGIGIVLSSAQSLDELKSRASDLNATDDAYDTGLLALASGYENCSEEIQEFNSIAEDASDEIKQQKRVALEAAVAIGEMAEEYGLSADEVEDLADEFQNLAKSGKNQYKILGEDGEAAADAAVRYKRLNDSVLDLSENYDDYKEVLKDISDASDDLDKAMIANSANGKKLQSSLAGLLGTSEDLINADLLGAIDPKDFEAAAEGDEAAIQRIRDAFIELQAEANGIDVSGLKEELAGLEEGIVVDINADTMPFLYALIEAQVAAGASAAEIESLLSGFNIDATVSDFEGTLAEAVAASESASAEIIANNSYTQDVKQTTVETPVVDEEIQYDTQYTPHQVDSYDLVLKNGADEPELVHQTRTEWTKSVTPTVVPTTMTEQEVGTEVTTSNAAGDSAPVKGVKIENAHKSTGGKVSNSTKRQAGNNMSGGKKGGGGGGGGKSKPAEKTKKSEIVERYKEFEDQLDDTREEADKLRESLDNLWGDDLAEAAERLIELEERERSLLEQKANEAREHLEEDKKALKKAAKDLDITFTFDAKGNITDYTEEMTELYQELADMEAAFGDEWSESEQEQIAALKEKISLLEEAMGDYEETRELLEDINIELDEMAGKAVLPEVKSDNFDYFKELNDELDDVEDALEKAQRNYERATSIEDKTKYLQEILTLEQQRLLIMEDQKARAEQVVAEQKLALEQLAELEGIEFEYDKNGNITNYDETIGAMWDDYYEKREAYLKDGKLSPDEEAVLEAMKSNIEDLTQYADDYSEAVEQLEDSVIALDEALGDLPDPYVKADHMDIYKENRDQIDDIEEEIDDARRKADKLTGDARVKALEEVAKLEEKRIRLLKEQKAIAESEIEERKAAMQEIADRNGAVMAIDENGNVTNYIEVMDALLENYEYLANGGDDGLINDAERIAMEALEADIKELQEYIDAYCDAVETAEDIQNEIEDSAEGGYIDISNLDDTIDKLHDINNTLDEIQESLDDSSKAADRLYGSARIAQMQKTASLLQKEISALEKKAELQKDIIADEQAELNMKASAMSTTFTFDDRGNVTNYRAVMEAERAEIEAKKAELEADGNFTTDDQALIEGMIENYEDLADAVEEYEQALEDAEDIQNEIQDAFYEWQDLNAEMLSYELELKLQVNDRELAKIERAINRISDDFYQRAEAAAMMIGGGAGGSSQYSTYMSRLNELESQYNKVHQAYLAGEISQAAYVEQTRAIEAEIENVNASLESLQDTMDDYYKNTLAAARQELKFYTDQMSHLTGVLNHFKSILQALGKQNDYEMMDRVLRGQVETLENEVQVQKEAMALWKSQADQLYADYERELAAGNTENANMYYKAYQEALNAANEAENQYYAKAQQWANALKALMQNTLSDLAQDLENSLTGGTSFDTINTQLKRASSLQEEYLTTTNKIYETTKLMRTAQNEIDKTTNSVAKQKFANFINETKQLQNQNKLSKYELSIQQAKYDLLVAEIALEEARFAKSTVRLQRDSEGNFGYVYTANAEAVANAEQKFEDASNKLYNLALEGANKYVEKYQQTLSEMYDTLTSLQKKYLDGGFESEEEYNRAVLEAKEYYYAKLQDYSSLYQVAITTDSAVIADAWSTDFADMTEKTDQWMQSVNSYLDEVVIAFQEWEKESDRIANETIGKDLDALEQNVKDITDRSEELVTQITDPVNGVIKAISDELAAVKALTDQYASLRGEITGTIAANDALIESMEKDIQASEEAEKGKVDGNQNNDPEIDVNDGIPPTDNTTDDSTDDTGDSDTGGDQQDPPQDNPSEGGKVPEPDALCSHESGTTTEVTKAATCTKNGEKVIKCAKCGEKIRTESIPKLGHDTSGGWKYDKKNHWKVCSRCKEKIDPEAHKLKNGKCSVCGYVPDSKENKVIEVGDTPIYKSGKYYHDSYGTSPAGTRGQGKKVKVTQVIKNPKSGQDYPIHVESSDSAYGWLKASQLEGYDTGGYTGAWGSSGKLAMLHEKEIILNKDDTKNFLASLDLLDSILSTIDLHAMNSQFNTMINSPYVSGLAKEALQQNVSIEASFPNATDKKEIEEAFKDLVNLASQYTNRK